VTARRSAPARARRRNTERRAGAQQRVLAATRDWLEKAVIGLDLCPFAPAVHRLGLIRYKVTARRSPQGLALDLAGELVALHAADPAQCETTLLIHPHVLREFGAYNDFLDVADTVVRALGLEGELQIASFHPDYRFRGSLAADPANYTNRSPYPMLHLLREKSVAHGLATYPDASGITARNVAAMRALGAAGWGALWHP
jgi:hypothetical protein